MEKMNYYSATIDPVTVLKFGSNRGKGLSKWDWWRLDDIILPLTQIMQFSKFCVIILHFYILNKNMYTWYMLSEKLGFVQKLFSLNLEIVNSNIFAEIQVGKTELQTALLYTMQYTYKYK